MFEHYHQRLISRREFALRMVGSTAVGMAMVVVSLTIGVIGYRCFGALGWVDAILNASMILTGMGPVAQMTTTGGKLFASGYALFSGIVFLGTVGVIVAPIAHRFLHRFHMDVEENEKAEEKAEGDEAAGTGAKRGAAKTRKRPAG